VFRSGSSVLSDRASAFCHFIPSPPLATRARLIAMSVFTSVTAEQVSIWLKRYSLGTLESFAGIAEGVQNSNFFLHTSQGAYVLTIFEQLVRDELPFYVNLMAHLARHGIPCPAPLANRDNDYLGELQGKPAIVVSRLAGTSEAAPTPAHCAAIGAMLANLHLAAQSYGGRQAHSRGRVWCRETAAQVLPSLDEEDATLMRDELRHQAQHRPGDLPRGVIHADLFRDNVLFDGERVSGLLDFYFAGVDDLLFDLAVTVNDWCSETDGTLAAERTSALLAAYHASRPLTVGERAAWPTMLRAAALRFWLSRLQDFHRPRAGDLVVRRDPAAYRTILLARIAAGTDLPWLASPSRAG
jgi:homoserine kinase type II